MTPAPGVSVVVVSRDRPRSLLRCLAGLEQQYLPGFEVVVIADPAGCAAVAGSRYASRVKLGEFDVPNISEARNLGIARAAGGIVAFIDDDAVPEPTWLTHLTGAFALPGVAAATGYVRGRNGISFQWTARSVDAEGLTRPLVVPDDRPFVPDPGPGRCTKLEGTTMAIRRDVLAEMGGFDPAFAFYLDETDLGQRLADAGHRVAVVPLAQVHHGYAESERRQPDRTPRDLRTIGQSSAVFLRKHAPDDIAARRRLMRDEQRLRLVEHMVAGRCMPGDVARILRTFDDGFEAGLTTPLAPPTPLPDADTPLLPFAEPPSGAVTIAGRLFRRRALDAQAAVARAAGKVVTLMRFSRSALFHSVRFRDDGIWLHRGGIHGRTDRAQPLWQPGSLTARARRESARVAATRQLQ